MIESHGNGYLREHFPELSHIRKVTIVGSEEIHDPNDLLRESILEHPSTPLFLDHTEL